MAFKVFNDNVHQHIELSAVSVAVIDTPQFQRLRNLRQLGGVYQVFPSAGHHRFEHSLGVAHLARTFVAALAAAQPELGITPQEALCVELAGLCHDLGHGIMSHMYDRKFIPLVRPTCTWEHEHASIDMLHHLIATNPRVGKAMQAAGLSTDPGGHVHLVAELILGDAAHAPAGWRWKGVPPAKQFLFEIVANKRNCIDVDKLDYFSRDCLHLNLAIPFDAARLMKFARVVALPGGHGSTTIAFAAKEAWNVYQLFSSRYSLHKRAYQHRIARVVETMMTQALILADPYVRIPGAGGVSYRMSTAMHDMEAYTRCTDHLISVIEHSTEEELAPARAVLAALRRRELYAFVGETVWSTNIATATIAALTARTPPSSSSIGRGGTPRRPASALLPSAPTLGEGEGEGTGVQRDLPPPPALPPAALGTPLRHPVPMATGGTGRPGDTTVAASMATGLEMDDAGGVPSSLSQGVAAGRPGVSTSSAIASGPPLPMLPVDLAALSSTPPRGGGVGHKRRRDEAVGEGAASGSRAHASRSTPPSPTPTAGGPPQSQRDQEAVIGDELFRLAVSLGLATDGGAAGLDGGDAGAATTSQPPSVPSTSASPACPALRRDDVIVEIITIDMGMGDRNPVDFVTFYHTDKLTGQLVVGPISREQVSIFVPHVYRERYVRVYCQRHGAPAAAVRTAFEAWCASTAATSPLPFSPARMAAKRPRHSDAEEEEAEEEDGGGRDGGTISLTAW